MKKGSKRVERPGLSSEEVDEIKQAFDLYDHDGSQKIRIQECIEGMKSVNFDKTINAFLIISAPLTFLSI